MRKNFISIFLFISAFIGGQALAAQAETNYPRKNINGKDYYEYPVQKSEGFYSITKKFNVSKEEILKANPGTEKGLSMGSVLLIPVKNTGYTVHKVSSKETMFSIKKKYGVSYDEIYAINPGLKEKGLISGTEIKIPEQKKEKVLIAAASEEKNAEIKANSQPSSFLSHKVQKGETLFSISQAYGVSADEITKLNPDIKDGLKVGGMLIIPPSKNSVSAGSEKKELKTHVVKTGETLFSISKLYNVSQEAIIKRNPEAKNGLTVGKLLFIPPVFGSEEDKEKGPKANIKSHIVKTGETLYSISKQYGVSQDAIIQKNPDVKSGLTVGKLLIIPPVYTANEFKDEDFKGQRSELKTHIVKEGETLYSISKLYGVSQDAVVQKNPSAKDGLSVGKILFIPPVYGSNAFKENVATITHEVKKKETLYSISKKYNVSVSEIMSLNPGCEQGIEKGMNLIIPDVNDPMYASSQLILPNEPIAEPDSTSAKQTEPKSTINVALFLPFQFYKVNENTKIDANTDKFLEFYQGMLVAIDTLRKQNLSVNLKVIDSGKNEGDAIKMIESDNDLKNCDFIIGPAYTAQLKVLSKFAKENNVKLIIPFSSKSEETLNNENIIQINTPQKESAAATANKFAENFSDRNIVLVRFTEQTYDDKKVLGDTLNSILSQNNVKFNTILFDKNDKNAVNKLHSELKKYVKKDAKNVIFPITNNQVALSQVLPVINFLIDGKTDVSIFGLNDWLTYQGISKDMFKMNTYASSPFYSDYKENEVKNFLVKFRCYYNDEPKNTQPVYGMLGYDIMFFFGNAVSKFGHDFEDKINDVDVNTLQSNFIFDKISENGGYYNKCVFIINHSTVEGLKVVK